eukprot:TRINITY_DN247_c0_g1_i1.p1 TRINITY_DN247_c0_g1~~TRINITY_DN247_c0_g1_i1.p1  ORF type:complete len:536 (+),score=84.00 TRINITY_DN247_c0_g1_i1:49-1608(+)
MKIALLLVLLAYALFDQVSSTCPPIPRTGCFQSKNVDSTIRSNIFGNINGYDWVWTNDGEDYGLPVTYPTKSSSNPFGLYVICVYNGNTVTQTETIAPSTAGSVLGSFPALLDANLDISSSTPKKLSVQTFGIARLWAQGLSSSEKANAITQLIDLQSSACWSKTVSFVDSNPPPFKVGGYLNLTLTPTILNTLAARYNARSAGQPLNMIAFSSAIGPADLFQKTATVNLTNFDLRSHLSTFHVLGWYGGLWFLRDGFSGIPPGTSGPTLDAVNNAYESVAELIESQQLTALATFIETTTLNPPQNLGSGSGRDTVSSFGYNTGYSYQVIDAGRALATSTGNSGFLAPAGALFCQGLHPECTFSQGPNCPAATGTELLGCDFTPQQIPAIDDLRSSMNLYKSVFPSSAASLHARQDNTEPVGRQVWLFLSSRIASTTTVYQTLYGVNNAFLETLVTSALLAFDYGIQTPGSSDALRSGTRAALSIGQGQAWLTSYNFALYSSSGGLPFFNLGKTPITVA